VRTIVAVVSFARTPLAEVSAKAQEIGALGWRETDRADPWLVTYSKPFPEDEHQKAEDELRQVMGDYWLTAEDMGALRAK
jgi:hypothetical protein